MDHIAEAEEQIVTERLMRKLEKVNEAAKSQLEPIQDHVNFNLQKAYFECAHECFDRSRRQVEINNCVENCSVPVVTANDVVETEMAKFQEKDVVMPMIFISNNDLFTFLPNLLERMNRSFMVCQDKFETAKLRNIKTEALQDLESCVGRAIEENIEILPNIVDHVKASLSIE